MPRIDPLRSALAATAAISAVMGAVASNADHGMMGWELGARVFPVVAVIAAAFAVVPSAGRWSSRRRLLAAVTAGVASWPSVLLLITTGSRACVCGDPSSPDFGVLPTIFGIAAHDWLVTAAIAVPLWSRPVSPCLVASDAEQRTRIQSRARRRPLSTAVLRARSSPAGRARALWNAVDRGVPPAT